MRTKKKQFYQNYVKKHSYGLIYDKNIRNSTVNCLHKDTKIEYF
jgi:hypothetical protein